MPAPSAASKSAPASPEPGPRLKNYRCIVKTEVRPDGAHYPMGPFWASSFGGKAFAVSTYIRRKVPGGETQDIPVRGIIEEFLVGGPACELERVKAAIRRKVVRWDNKEKGRGKVLSVRLNERKRDANGAWMNEWEERPNPMFFSRPGDEPVSNFVQIEEVVEGSEHGPVVPLE